MKITILAVGKLKEEYLKKAAARFSKEISRHCGFSLIEIPDESNENRSPKTVKETEGEGILTRIRPEQYVIALAIDGKYKTSEEFRSFLKKQGSGDRNDLVFVIGGSLGLSPEVLQRANEKLSFSPMTFPHQLMRIMLMEQVVAALKGDW